MNRRIDHWSGTVNFILGGRIFLSGFVELRLQPRPRRAAFAGRGCARSDEMSVVARISEMRG